MIDIFVSFFKLTYLIAALFKVSLQLLIFSLLPLYFLNYFREIFLCGFQTIDVICAQLMLVLQCSSHNGQVLFYHLVLFYNYCVFFPQLCIFNLRIIVSVLCLTHFATKVAILIVLINYASGQVIQFIFLLSNDLLLSVDSIFIIPLSFVLLLIEFCHAGIQ